MPQSRQHSGNALEHLFAYNRIVAKKLYDWAAIQRYHDEGQASSNA